MLSHPEMTGTFAIIANFILLCSKGAGVAK
jgi:hypothetical protein